MISVLFFMAVGMFVGAKLFPAKLQKANSIIQQACVFLLIFSMGISLGSERSYLLGGSKECGLGVGGFCSRDHWREHSIRGTSDPARFWG